MLWFLIMSPKKDSSSSSESTRVDDLIAALKDERVQEVFGSIFESRLQKIVDTVARLSAEFNSAKEDIDALKTENDQLKLQIQSMNDMIQSNTARTEQLDSYSRLDNIIIKGLPDTYAATAQPATSESASAEPTADEAREDRDTTLAAVLNLCEKHLKVNITANDISLTHRLPKGRADKYRPVIVRFANRRSRDVVYKARRELRNSRPVSSPIYINEHLTKKADELFTACRRIWKNGAIASTWTWNGSVYIKQLHASGGLIVKVKDLSDLATLQWLPMSV